MYRKMVAETGTLFLSARTITGKPAVRWKSVILWPLPRQMSAKPADGNHMTIKVKKVIDGDTFQDSRNRFYRLTEVDAPEKKERGYKSAKVALQNMIGGEELVVKQVGESYNRKVVIARIRGEKTTINTKMKRKV
jgi:endonuclease YncB( thermonuclease family)